MQRTTLHLVNKLGLHARAATKLSQCANQFASKVSIECKDKVVDGKSIMSVMLLAASCGTELTLTTDGDDELDAMKTLRELIAARFGEES